MKENFFRLLKQDNSKANETRSFLFALGVNTQCVCSKCPVLCVSIQ